MVDWTLKTNHPHPHNITSAINLTALPSLRHLCHPFYTSAIPLTALPPHPTSLPTFWHCPHPSYCPVGTLSLDCCAFDKHVFVLEITPLYSWRLRVVCSPGCTEQCQDGGVRPSVPHGEEWQGAVRGHPGAGDAAGTHRPASTGLRYLPGWEKDIQCKGRLLFLKVFFF